MFSILSKIFRKRLKPFSFLLSAIGLCLGLTLVLFSIRLYFSVVRPAQQEIGKSDYIIINKDVSIGNTLFNSKASFSSEEISELKSQKFSSGIAEFIPNQFTVKAYAGAGIPFMTDLFFEAVPNEYIDNCPYSFRWEEGDDFLPIIVSEDFINLYNYSFAAMNGLPQVSPSSVTAIPLRIVLKGPSGQNVTMEGRIVGYSERIASVLVPETFLKWANKRIGQQQKTPEVSRLMIKVNKEFASSMEDFLTSKGYQVNSERLMQNKIGAYANTLTQILVLLGGLFILFSFIIVLQNFALILSEARQDMNLLIQLGYTIGSITGFLFRILFSYILAVMFLATALYYLVFTLLTQYLHYRNLTSGPVLGTEVLITLGAVCTLLVLTGLLSIRGGVKRYQ